ncbi:MAG: sigma-54-dependent Fis family transcriptional regulator [Candidatus Marinimicrobia bacterium]|nr:sigma-54-dependent Fis family transcriptional regulator [Candidatus Neomarinimicrobiota bacterium]
MPIDLETLQRQSGIIGESEPIQEVLQTIATIAPTDISVLITGESGTGKEMVAKAIHKSSRRRFGPMVTVNCGAIPAGIIESELFGHKKGSFTGADETRKGYFEAADEGTIFLDEIGETPPETQVKMLRVIEQGEFMRVGDNETRKVDVRVIAATNRDLGADTRRGDFRQDLYYRLKTVTIPLPPLRDHLSDIPQLVERFGLQFATRNDLVFKGFTPEALNMLKAYGWPGNVRELKNVVESIIALNSGARITPDMLRSQISVGGYDGAQSTLPVVLNIPAEQSDRELILRQLLFIRQDLSDIKQIAAGRGPGEAVDPYLPSPVPVQGEELGGQIFTGDVAQLGSHPLIDPAAVGELTMEELERELIQQTLAKFNHNRRRTAQALGIAERTLYRKIQAYGLDKK